MKLKPKTRKYVTVISIILLAALNITKPINIQSMFPTWLLGFSIGDIGFVNIVAYVTILGAYWVGTRQTD